MLKSGLQLECDARIFLLSVSYKLQNKQRIRKDASDVLLLEKYVPKIYTKNFLTKISGKPRFSIFI